MPLDLDGTSPDAFAEMCMMLGEYSGFGYTTASHTTESPHARFILELSRPVDRAEGIRLGQAMQQRIEARLSLGIVKLDSSVYRADQPIFGPLQNADVMRYHGDPVDVDAVLATTPAEPVHERSTTADPYRALLIERGLLLRELGPGKDAITCPFARDHSEVTSDTSTVYLWPHYGGYKWGHIHCSHTHCAERKDEDYTRELGVELRGVWRRQAGAAPYDDLPPVESYDEADQQGARRHTPSAKAPAARGETRQGNGASPAGACDGEVVHRCLFDIEEKPYRWLWQGRIARGKVTMLAGHPDLGKSQVTASMAAVVTIGGAWPVDRTQCEKGKVIILSAEDVPEDTIRPRFRAAGADLKLVEILDAVREPNRDGTLVERPFNLTADIERLSWLAREIGDVALIVIDPITAYLGNIDSHRNAEVRAVLAPLATMAAEIDAAVVCISHMTKVGGTEAMLRVMGSLGFVAAARAAYLVAKDLRKELRKNFASLRESLVLLCHSADGFNRAAFCFR